MKRALDLTALFATVAVLWLIMVWLREVDFGTVTTFHNPKSLAATGFIILAAFSMGEFFRLLKIPALLGYIAAGILFGPNLAPMLPNTPQALFSSAVISDLSLINILAIGVIGTMGGGELKISDIKQNFRSILWVVGLIFVIVVPVTFSSVLLLFDFFPEAVPFLADRTRDHAYAAGILFAVFGLAMSPAATLAILQETRAKGRFSSLVLGIVVVMDLMLVAMFLLALKFAQIFLAPGGFQMDELVNALPGIGAEFGYAILIGIVTGLVFILYLRFIRREQLFFTVAIIFTTAYVASLLHAEQLLAFLTAGFIVQNFSKHGHDMIHALEKISLPVFVIYFMTQAAILDLTAVGGFIVLTMVLTVTRGVAHVLGARLGTMFAGADPASKRYLWLGMFSLSGVDLVLAAIVGGSGIPWGPDVQTVIMSVVIIHIIVGPPLLKLALDWSGETEGSREQTREEAEAFDLLPAMTDESTGPARFPTPDFESPALNERMLELRDLLVSLHSDHVAGPLEQKSQTMRDSLAEASSELGEALDELHTALSSGEIQTPEQRAAQVAKIHVKYLNNIADNVRAWEAIEPEIVRYEQLGFLLDLLRNREDFAAIYRVEQESFLYLPEDDDPFSARFIKALRRVRRAMTGGTSRSVPLGRLWRYYVELTVPRYLARAADATARLSEKFWTDLGNHMRRVDDLFDAVYDAVSADSGPLPASRSAESGSNDAADAVDNEEALALIAEGKKTAREREVALREHLDHTAATALDRYTVSLHESYTKFLNAVRRAGTIELPQFRYRPSTLFDRSRRAEAQIRSRLQREHTVVTGQRGWIVAEWQLVLFLYWLEAYETRARETLAAMISSPVTGQLDVLRSVCLTVPGELLDAGWESLEEVQATAQDEEEGVLENARKWPAVDWDRWLTDEVIPAIDHTRANFQRMLALHAQGHVARRLLEILERRVARFSNELVLLSEHPDQIGPTDVVPTLRIPLREWFISEVVRETALRLVEFNERGETVVRNSLTTLEEVQHVVEFNLLTAHRDSNAGARIHAAELAAGGLQRAARMIEELRSSHAQRFDELTSWIVEETNKIAELAAEPFLQHRPAEIERLMSKRGQTSLAERGESWVMGSINRAVTRARGFYRRYRPVAAEMLEDLRGLFVEQEQPLHNRQIRERLHPDERAALPIPGIYRRLFTPVPLDIPDFYVSRPEIEDQLCSAVSAWANGKQNSILLYGDRGAGKRSTLHHILQQHGGELPAQVYDITVQTVLLDDDVQTEAELIERIAAVLPLDPPDTMDGLVRFSESLQSRHIVVIERGEKLFSRTDTGLHMCQQFLRMMNQTTDTILWIVLMGRPAVTFLETAIGILDYFTHSLALGPLSEESIEDMVYKRHRVSGFRASFERERPRLRDWVRRPIDTSDALRDPRAQYFRTLARLSEGNPMLALLYWLNSSRLDEADDHLIWLDPLPDEEPSLLASLSLNKRLILAALVQHHTLTPMHLRAILRAEFELVQTELKHLERLGFVREMAGRKATAYQLRSAAEAVVTSELRAMNMI